MSEKQEDRPTLSSLLEEDRERIMSEIGADRSVTNTSKVLEKEADRLLMRYSQESASETALVAAQQMMETVKSSLPAVESVTDVEVWQRDAPQQKPKGDVFGFVLLSAGGVLSVLPSLARPGSVLYVLIGAVCLGLGGFLLGRKQNGKAAGGSTSGAGGRSGQYTQKKFLVDPDSVYHLMKRMIMTVDRSLKAIPAYESSAPGRLTEGALPEHASAEAGESFSDAETEFFAELLENAYASARRDPENRSAQEQIENIRYYLHRKGIDATDFSDACERSWFEFLPSGGSRITLRPALVREGKLLKKGLASDR